MAEVLFLSHNPRQHYRSISPGWVLDCFLFLFLFLVFFTSFHITYTRSIQYIYKDEILLIHQIVPQNFLLNSFFIFSEIIRFNFTIFYLISVLINLSAFFIPTINFQLYLDPDCLLAMLLILSPFPGK